ncbi:MAG: autotransporter-associated beta strand repeat-containing protein [Roseibacillus sp.]
MSLLSGTSAQIFSWEPDLEGWDPLNNGAIGTSTIGATDGLQSLEVTQPMSDMWYSTPAVRNLSSAELQSIFTGAVNLKLDAFYPDPGYNSWTATPDVEIIIQGENVGYVGLGTRQLTVDAPSQTLTFPLALAQAEGMATSEWGQIILKFTYGNGGATSSEAKFYIDNFTSTIVADPPPASDFFWKGDADNNWTSLNWTSDLAGTVAGGALPSDGSIGIAFTADGVSEADTILGADQNVKSIVLNDNPSFVDILGSQNLTIGADGIWLSENSGNLLIDTSGTITLDANQIWKNKSASPITVNSQISGTGALTKSGAGPLELNNANTYTGGTTLEQGTLLMGNVAALGGPTASLTVDGGALDLNGFSPTIGELAGGIGSITNSSLTPSVLTLNTDAIASSYGFPINDDGVGRVSIIKKGFSDLTANGGSGFTGDMTIEEGAFVATFAQYNTPANLTCFGNAVSGGRTITVEEEGSVYMDNTYIMGIAPASASLLPEFILNGSLMECTRYNVLGDLTLSDALLESSSSDEGGKEGFQFIGRILVTGNAESYIESLNGKGNHLFQETTFEVEDTTGDLEPDLIVSNPLLDQSDDYGSFPGTLTKIGAGTMLISSVSTYTGDTFVDEGILRIENPFLSDTGALEVASGAELNLDFAQIDIVGALVLGGTEQTAPGTYGSLSSSADFKSALITGAGLLQIIDAAAPYDDWITGFPSLTGTDAERGADPDLDGLSNLAEFAFNSQPDVSDASGTTLGNLVEISSEQALVLTLPIRDGATFTAGSPATATITAEGFTYEIEGSNDLETFDQAVSEVLPALDAGLPALDTGWAYRSFRLDGNVGDGTPRGPKGFLRGAVVDDL